MDVRDQSSVWRACLSWCAFILFEVVVPAMSHFLFGCAIASTRPYNSVVLCLPLKVRQQVFFFFGELANNVTRAGAKRRRRPTRRQQPKTTKESSGEGNKAEDAAPNANRHPLHHPKKTKEDTGDHPCSEHALTKMEEDSSRILDCEGSCFFDKLYDESEAIMFSHISLCLLHFYYFFYKLFGHSVLLDL